MSDYEEEEPGDPSKKIEKQNLEDLLRTFWYSYEAIADVLRERYEVLFFEAQGGALPEVEAKEYELLKYWHDRDDGQIRESTADIGTLMVHIAGFYLQDDRKCVDQLKTIDQGTKK